MANYTTRDVTLLIDKSSEAITLKVGMHIVDLTLGEWSRMISNPVVAPRDVLIPLHRPEHD